MSANHGIFFWFPVNIFVWIRDILEKKKKEEEEKKDIWNETVYSIFLVWLYMYLKNICQ